MNLENVQFHTYHDTESVGIHIGKDVIYNILERFKNYKPYTDGLKNIYDEIIKYISYIELFDEIEKREAGIEEKQLRKLKRKLAKKGIVN